MGLALDSRRSKKGCFDVVSGPELTFFRSESSGEMTGVSLGGRALAPRGYDKNTQLSPALENAISTIRGCQTPRFNHSNLRYKFYVAK